MENNMGIQREIFEEFVEKLGEDKEFPDSVREEIRNLWESGEIISKEKIFEVIKRGCADVCED
jgi:hypothetical protein